jgi:uncharacterized protein YbbK (DUF523 family)
MNSKIKIRLCSACLLGVACRYDGKSKPNKKVLALLKDEVVIPVCPEQLGGQKTPRENSEIKEGRVISETGRDETEEFIRGANEVLKIAKLYNIKEAILKQRSPSCGYGQIYNGGLTGKIIKGNGFTADLLIKNGIKVISEEDL